MENNSENFDYQGKRPEQVENSGKMIVYSFVTFVIICALYCLFN